ncbi:Transcriptional regulator, HxlR family [plant metagenome]|uniref:Transcriptional regulator, HxlR family n=1 Tax=plant metagenome TaxID=1297885 RepID=A0A484Q448_9ZZZZ
MSTLVGKWKIDILFMLLGGPRRFGELRRALPGITQHMLTAQLRSLETDRFITRTVYAEVPPRVEYELAPAAQTLKPVFISLIEWSREWRVQLAQDAQGQSRTS